MSPQNALNNSLLAPSAHSISQWIQSVAKIATICVRAFVSSQNWRFLYYKRFFLYFFKNTHHHCHAHRECLLLMSTPLSPYTTRLRRIHLQRCVTAANLAEDATSYVWEEKCSALQNYVSRCRWFSVCQDNKTLMATFELEAISIHPRVIYYM